MGAESEAGSLKSEEESEIKAISHQLSAERGRAFVCGSAAGGHGASFPRGPRSEVKGRE